MNDQNLLQNMPTALLARSLESMEEETRGDNPKAFPFWYSFIPYPILGNTGSRDQNDFYTLPTGILAEGPDGLTLPASGLTDINIPMQRDADFHLLCMKYTAFNPDGIPEPGAVSVNGTREFLTAPQTSLQGGRTLFTATANQRHPWTSQIDAQVYINTGRDLYGGLQMNAGTQTKEDMLMPITAVQGREDGYGQMRLSAFILRLGYIRIRLQNRSATALRVHGHAFGYKIP